MRKDWQPGIPIHPRPMRPTERQPMAFLKLAHDCRDEQKCLAADTPDACRWPYPLDKDRLR